MPFNIPMPGSFSLIEILVVVLILGLIAGFVFGGIMPIKERAMESSLELLFVANQNTELGNLAEETLALLEQKQSLKGIARFADLDSEEVEELEDELRKSLELDGHAQQVGAAIKAIQEWQRKVKSRRQ
jgi:prepilin-type N-terminal cleavage/methylation domain-containing protein